MNGESVVHLFKKNEFYFKQIMMIIHEGYVTKQHY